MGGFYVDEKFAKVTRAIKKDYKSSNLQNEVDAMERKKRKGKSIFWYVLGSTALTVIGFVLMPPLIKMYGNKLYRYSLRKEESDFENLGPEIVKK